MKQQRVLRCPSCSGRFDYIQTSVVPENLVCPKCGRNHSINDYYAPMSCPHCNANLEVPWELLSEDSLNCPQCNKEFSPKILKKVNPETFDSTADALCRLGSAPKQMLQENEHFDKYKIIRLLGKGGMAEVYLAEHVILKQMCALKIMKQSMYEHDATGIKRFVREAKLSHSIKHPNIVGVYDVGNDSKNGYFFIAMEYIQGKNLLAIMRDHLFSEKELHDVIFSMAKVLIELDKHKIVHRDIKPSNIMIDDNGVLKLMDLGIAKADTTAIAGEMTLTMDNAAIGTPSYASPEQCQSAHLADHRSDIYCLGTTLYHLASGKLPFEGDTPMAILLKVVQTNPVPLAKLRPDLSKKMISLIEKMMKKDPNQRPQSGGEILAILMRNVNPSVEIIHKYGWKKIAVVCACIFAALMFLASSSKLFSNSPENPKTAQLEQTEEEEEEEEETDNKPQGITPPVKREPPVIPKTKIPVATVTAKKNAEPITLLPPKPGKDGRTIAFRLQENFWMTQMITRQPDTMPLKIEKILFLNLQRDTLEKLMAKKNDLKGKASASVMDNELKTQLQKIVQLRATGQSIPPEELKKVRYNLNVGLKSSLINPNTTIQLDGKYYSLLELILKGYLPFPKVLEIADILLQAGADPDRIDIVSLPTISQNSKILFNILHSILKAGRNNIDTWNQQPILSLVFAKSENKQMFFSSSRIPYNWDLPKYIVENRGLLSFRDQNNRSLAHYAAAWNKPEIVEKLILSGFKDISAPDNTGFTAYQLAMRNGATAAIEAFEKYNMQTACSEMDRNQGELLKAIAKDDLKKIMTLTEKQDLISCKYVNTLTPLQLAVAANANKSAAYLYSKTTNKNDFFICHTVFISVYAGNVPMFKFLLEKNPQLDPAKVLLFRTPNKTYSLPLCIIFKHKKNPAVVRSFLDVLLKNKWNINSSVIEGSSATLLQMIQNDPNVSNEIKNYLIKNGAQ